VMAAQSVARKNPIRRAKYLMRAARQLSEPGVRNRVRIRRRSSAGWA
jgi:hypothetical protein